MIVDFSYLLNFVLPYVEIKCIFTNLCPNKFTAYIYLSQSLLLNYAEIFFKNWRKDWRGVKFVVPCPTQKNSIQNNSWILFPFYKVSLNIGSLT